MAPTFLPGLSDLLAVVSEDGWGQEEGGRVNIFEAPITEKDIMDALAEGIACYFDPNCTPPERKAVLGDVDFSLMATTQTPVLPHAEASNNAAIYVTGAGVLGAAALVTYAFFKRQPKTHSLE